MIGGGRVVTDGMMEMLNRLIDLCDGNVIVTGIDIAADALAEYRDDGWHMMLEAERDEWLSDVVARHYDLGK